MTKKITIIGIIIVIFLGIGSFFVFPEKEIELKELNEPDITFAYIWDNEKKETAPTKDSGYAFDDANSSCINGTEIYWDTESWSAKIKNLKNTKTSCTLSFNKKYTEKLLDGTDPVLGTGMVPITIDNDGKVHKADISTAWYKYGEKKWANAVILADETKEYKNGEVIPEENIESYFVWIPRYKYTLKDNESTYNGYNSVISVGNKDTVDDFYKERPNQATNKVFEITFETKDKTIESGTTAGSYVTHPAFLSFDSNGFWVGKFETGYNQNDDNNNVKTSSTWSVDGANQNIQNSSKVIIKPNVYSWRNINVSNAFYTSYEYKRELESHMMKNTEWGAVAYLTQSKYGRCTNESCEEIRINNSENFITGMSAKNASTCGYTGTNETCNHYETIGLGKDGETINNYNNQESVASSTTENYTGVYDMNGGAWDYVMGVMKGIKNDTSTPASGRNKDNNSGFKGPYSYCNENGAANGDNCNVDIQNTTGKEWPSSKYYDLYAYYTTNLQWQRGILGDGTKELGPFYSVRWPQTGGTYVGRTVSSYNADLAFFVTAASPWFLRGGSCHDGTDSGIFAFNLYRGTEDSNSTFRVILTP